MPGGKIGSDVPGPSNADDPADGKPASKNSFPLLPISVPLGLGLVGYGIYRSRKEDGSPQEAVPAGSVYKPSFSSDPVGVIADYAFQAKIAIEDHPLATLGTVGPVALGALYFGGTMLMGAGGGGAAGMGPSAATAGAATAELGSAGVVSGAAKTLAGIGGVVVVSKGAWDHISFAKTGASQSGDEDGGDKPTSQSRLRDAKLPSEGDFKFEPPDKYRPGNEDLASDELAHQLHADSWGRKRRIPAMLT